MGLFSWLKSDKKNPQKGVEAAPPANEGSSEPLFPADPIEPVKPTPANLATEKPGDVEKQIRLKETPIRQAPRRTDAQKNDVAPEQGDTADLAEKPPGKSAAAQPLAAPADREPVGTTETIWVRLAPILESLPVGVERPALHHFGQTDVRIALSKDSIESQLPSGRVAIPLPEFLQGLPADIRDAFGSVDPGATVPIPLQEIFRELPMESIKTRADQVVEVAPEAIVTPFSEHAREDAARFTPTGENQAREVPATAQGGNEHAPRADYDVLRTLLVTDEELDISKVVALTSQLPGVQRSLLTTLNGQKIAGDLGESRYTKAAAFLLPHLFTTAARTVGEISFRPIETLTLNFGDEQLSSFVQEHLCLTILHPSRPLRPGVRETIVKVLAELVRLRPATIPPKDHASP